MDGQERAVEAHLVNIGLLNEVTIYGKAMLEDKISPKYGEEIRSLETLPLGRCI